MQSSAVDSCPVLGQPQNPNRQRCAEPPSVRLRCLAVGFVLLLLLLWSSWRHLGIPWTFLALAWISSWLIPIINLTLGAPPAAGFPSVSTLDLAPGSPGFHIHVFTCSWEPQLLGQFLTNHEGTAFPRGLLLGCMSPLTEGPRENDCLLSLSIAQVHNLTCVPHLFTLKEFPLQALSGLLKDAPSFS